MLFVQIMICCVFLELSLSSQILYYFYILFNVKCNSMVRDVLNYLQMVNTRRTCCFLLLALGVLLQAKITIANTSLQQVLSPEEPPYELWSEFLNEQMQEYILSEKIPNASIALVSVDDIHLLQGYGYANMENEVVLDPDTHLFRTGSVSKIFTWTAVMQLYEKGLLHPDVDIRQYLDFELKNKIAYKSQKEDKDTYWVPFDRISSVEADDFEGENPITLYHLMSHTAGFEDVMEGLFCFSPQPGLRDYLMNHNPYRIYPPGKIMAYSNYGTALAGYIVELISGMNFEDYVKENIFDPLGMYKSSFEQPLPIILKEDMVSAYRWVDGEYLLGNFEFMPSPAGGLSTTAADMALFMQASLNQGKNTLGEILQPISLEKMHSTLFRYHPLVDGMTHGLMEASINGQRIIQHGGSSSVFDAGFYLLPDVNTGIFIVYSGGNYLGHLNIIQNFMDEFFVTDNDGEENLTPLYAADMSDLEGEYHQSRTIKSGKDKILNLLMGSLNLGVDDELINFNLYGKDYSFKEIIPGIFKTTRINDGYPFGPVDYLLIDRSPDDRMMLIINGPMIYIKARWYETASFALLVFATAMVLAIGSLLFFLIRGLYRLIKQLGLKGSSSTKRRNRILIAHSLSLMGFVMVISVGNSPHPVHLIPESFFTPSPVLDFLSTGLALLITALGFILLWLALIAWRRKELSLPARLYYSLYAITALGTGWLFSFYNFTQL